MFYRKTQRSRRNYSNGYNEMPSSYANRNAPGLSKTSISAKKSINNSTAEHDTLITKPGAISVTQSVEVSLSQPSPFPPLSPGIFV